MTKVECGAIVCLHNKEGECQLAEISLYTGTRVFCEECDSEFQHDLVDCNNYEKDPNFKYVEVER